MADEAKLQIILEAINQTANPFNDLIASLDSVQKSASELAKALSDSFQAITTATNSSATSTEESMSGIGKAASELTKAVNGTASDIENDMRTATTSVGDFEKSAAADLSNASKEMDSLRSNMNHGIGEIGGLIAVQQLGQSMEELGKKGEHLFDYAVEQGSDFQQSMKNVQTVIAANADGTGTWQEKLQGAVGITQKLQDQALALGSRGAQSANEVAKAQDAMIRSGVDATAVLGGAAEAAQNVAIVTGDKLDESANLVTEIYHQFRDAFAVNGKSVQENMKTTGDVLTGTLLSARINSQDFLDTLKYVGPVASQLGSSLLDASTATALLAQNGIKGSQAGNNLKRAITNLLEPTKQGAEAMKELGLIQNGHNKVVDESTGSMKNLTEVQEILHKSMEGLTKVQKEHYTHAIFGQYALAGTLVLANENSEAFQKMKEHIGNVSAEQAASNMLDTFSGHMAQLKAHVETTAKEFGLAFIPVLEKLLPIGQKILGWFQELTPANKKFLMVILAVGSAVGIAGGALAGMAISMKFAGEGFKAIKGIFMIQKEGEAAISIFKKFALAVREVGLAEAFMDLMSPVGWITLAVAAIVGLSVVIIQHWGQIKEFLQKTWEETTKIATDVWGAVSKFFVDLWKTIVDATTTAWNSIKQFFSDIFSAIGGAFTTSVNAIKDTWNGFINGIQSLWTGFKTWIGNAVNEAMQAIVDAFNWMYNHNYYFKDLVDFITKEWTTVKTDTTQLWNELTKWLSDTWKFISDTAYTVWTDVADFFTKLWQGIKNIAEAFWNAEKIFYTTIWNAIVGVAKLVWGPISKFFSDTWDTISKDVDSAWSTISTAISGWFNGIVTDGEGIFNGLGTFFSNLWKEAYDWGSNLVHMVGEGIKHAASEVADAAKDVAGQIAKFLGFHSPTEEGPASSSDQWAPNFIKMFAGGLKDGAPTVADAAQSLISPLADSFSALAGGNQFDAEHIGSTVQLIINAKKQYADAAARNDQSAMDSSHKMADEYRSNLTSMGVNAKLFSQDTSIDDCMKNLQMISQQSTTNTKNAYSSMTAGMLSNNAALSTNTQASTAGMAQSWTDTRNSTVSVAMDMGNSLKAILDFIAANVTNMCHIAENAFTSAFAAIANNVASSMNQVVASVNMAKAAMASMGAGAGASLGVTALAAGGIVSGPTLALIGEGSEPEVVSPLSKLPAVAAAMAPVSGGYGRGGAGGGNVYITVQANGNITENEKKLGDIVSKAVLDKIKMQGKIG